MILTQNQIERLESLPLAVNKLGRGSGATQAPKLKIMKGVRIVAEQKSALNQGINYDPKEMAATFNAWKIQFGEEEATKKILAKLHGNPGFYFNQFIKSFTWDNVEVADRAYYLGYCPPDKWFPSALDSNWGARTYQDSRTVYQNCSFHHLGGIADDGHAVYSNVSGIIFLMSCLFDLLGGQAFQGVDRHDSIKKGLLSVENRKPVTNPTVVLAANRILRTGLSDTRGSFPISIVSLGTRELPGDVYILGNLIHCDWGQQYIEGNKSWARSRGGILVAGSAKEYHQFRLVVIRNNSVILNAPDRQALVVNNSESVRVEYNHFEGLGGSKFLDIDRMEYENDSDVLSCSSLIWTGNTGNLTVRYRGKTLGSVEGDYEIKNGKLV